MKTSILEYLEESARKYPDKTAFADEHTSCTFKELEQTARRTEILLAKKADEVVRVICGIGQKIK